MRLIGASDTTPFPGPSLDASWTASAAQDWPYPVAEISRAPFNDMRTTQIYSGSIRSVLTPRWHYINHTKTGAELYDWRADPDELRNLATTDEGRAVCGQLAAHLQRLDNGVRHARRVVRPGTRAAQR